MVAVRRWPSIFVLRCRSIFRKAAAERELQKELQFHLDQEIEEACAHGLPLAEAISKARSRMGGIAQIEEECRDMRRTSFIESLGQDIRYAARVLVKSPGFTLAMVLTLALSLAATSCILSVLEGVLVRPLPFHDPGRLVRIFTANRHWPKFPVNPNDFRDFRARLHSFESLAAYTHTDLQLSNAGEPVRLSGFSVTARYFHVLGVKPAMGREFVTEDELPARKFVAVVSDKLWRTRLGGRRSVLGQKITLDQIPYEIVGVMPPGMQHPGNMYHAVMYGDPVDIWTPFAYPHPNDRGSHFLDVIGRLRSNVSPAQAQGELNATMLQLAREHPDSDSGWKVFVIPLQKEIVGHTDQMLFLLLGAVALVLLLACVNAANLLLARATSRQREIAVRSALGARRSRLVRQMLTESLVLAFAGASLGAVLSAVGLRAFTSVLPANFPRVGDIHIDSQMFLFALVLGFGTGVLFGIVPALQGSRSDLRRSLHEGGRTTTGAQATLRTRSGLVVSEVTLACVLLIGAGLMLRSFINLLLADRGFRPDHVLTATISLPHATYKDPRSVASFSERLLAEIRAVPGVTAAGIGSDLPWTGWDDNEGGFQIQGEEPPPHEEFSARYHMASLGYFRTLGIPLIRGRAFDEHDTFAGRKVLIINQALAKAWKNGDALGGKVAFTDHPKDADWMTVVGIVAAIKDTPANASAKAAFWWPMPQAPFSTFSVALRSDLDPGQAANSLRNAVRRLDRGLAIADLRTMDQVADESYSPARFALAIVGLFAVLAVLMAAIGMYGVIAYSVNLRVHEFGIRMALGASSRDLVRSVLISGVKLSLWGIALGILLGITVSRFLGTFLYAVSGSDPFAIGATALISVVVAAVACSVPAVRATRVDPMNALRAD